MCDPSMFLAAASAGAKGVSALGSGFANSSLDQFSASIADTNAKIAAINGGIAGAKGALDVGRTATSVNDAVAAAGLHFGAAHLDPTYGSPLFQQTNSVLQGEGDKAIIAARTSAAQAADKAAEASAIGQKDALLIKSKSDVMSGYFGAATALLSPQLASAFKGAKWPWQSGATGASSITPDAFGGE